MSVRAYKIEKISDKVSFNLSWEKELRDVLDSYGLLKNFDGYTGIITICEDEWNEIKKELKRTDKQVIKQIDKDIKEFGYADYYCY